MQSDARVSLISVNNQLFAIEIKYIREVLPLPKITRLPNVERHFYGVFNLRGKILPLIDIAPVLGLKAQNIKKDYFVMVCEVNGKIAGLLTEKVLEMRTLETEHLHVPENDIPPELMPYVSAVYETSKPGAIYVLDMPSIFESEALNKYQFE